MSTNPDPDLMRIFDFTPADLEANRVGRMSKRECDRLQKVYNKQRASFLFAAIALPLLMCFFLLLFKSTYGIGLFLCFPLPTGCAMLFSVFMRDKKLASDLANQKVKYLDGEVKYWSGKNDYGYIRMNKHQFEIDIDTNLKLRDLMKKQTQSQSLRVYFSPRTNVILSVEILK